MPDVHFDSEKITSQVKAYGTCPIDIGRPMRRKDCSLALIFLPNIFFVISYAIQGSRGILLRFVCRNTSSYLNSKEIRKV